MINVKEAVAKAIQKANEFYSDTGLTDLTLEEVEMTDDKRYWLITLGFLLPNMNPDIGIGGMILGKKYERKYKVFMVDRETGDVMSMKIREL